MLRNNSPQYKETIFVPFKSRAVTIVVFETQAKTKSLEEQFFSHLIQATIIFAAGSSVFLIRVSIIAQNIRPG